jgi:vitamin K-dependent gamma-carboxylase
VKLELAIVYTYAGVAKLNIDWLRGEPLRHWLIKRYTYPLIGWLLVYEPVVYWFSYAGKRALLVVETSR